MIEHLYESGILPFWHIVDGTRYIMDIPALSFFCLIGVCFLDIFVAVKMDKYYQVKDSERNK